MLNKLLEKLIRLLEVKSIITLMLISIVCYGFVVGTVPVELFSTWVGAVITYFFTRKHLENK